MKVPRRQDDVRAGRLCRRGGALLLAAGVWLAGLAGPAARADDAVPFREYDVKAVFLFNFAQFVEWPDVRAAATNMPFVIGVLGEDPFGAILDQTVSGEHVRGRPLEVHRYLRIEDVKGCDLLFVSRSERGRLADIVRRLSGQGILTVGDTEPFGRLGGIITFRTSKSRVQLQINAAAAEREGFRISAKLLKVAQVVSEEP